MKANRQATKKDFYIGSKLIYIRTGATVTIKDKYDDGIWEAMLTIGSRYIGEKVIYECEAEFYEVI